MIRMRAARLEIMETSEPTAKVIAAEEPSSVRKKSSKKAMTTKTKQKRYSSFRNERAA